MAMSIPVRLVLFTVLSAIALAASRHAWRARESYGAYRFLGFEAIALLVAWNAPYWFDRPLSIRQLTSWTLFVASVALAAHGIHELRAEGRARSRVMEDTQRVVETGVYHYIRHPLYASLGLFAWGVALKHPDLPSAALAAAASLMLVLTARREEEANAKRLGEAYSAYMSRTKMFIPFIL
jgi:protein-S-isoprenylcysteine O-methyltransferase Ste14